MKAFLFVFDQSRLDSESVKKRVDRMAEVANWYSFFGNTMCLASELDSKQLAVLFKEAFPDLRFIVTEVSAKKQHGWLPQSVWSFLNDPQPVDAESA